MGKTFGRIFTIAVFLLALGASWLSLPMNRADAAPFTATCTAGSRYFLALINGTASPQTTQLEEQVLNPAYDPNTPGSTQYLYNNIGAAYNAGGTYNAIGYNSQDGLIWGILGISGTQRLVAIDDTGAIVNDRGTVPGLPNQFFQQGAMDTSGNLYVRSSAADTNIYKIDVDAASLSATTITLSQAINVGDFTFLGGYLWGVNTTGGAPVMRVNVTTGQVNAFPQTVVPDPVNPYAANWTYGDGSIGMVERETGNFFRMGIANPTSATPTFSLITSGSVPINGAINNADGTSCIAPPTDVGIVASAPPLVETNSSFNVTYTVTNNGPSGSSGQVVHQVLPPEMVNPTTSTPGCTITNVSGQNVLHCDHGPLTNGSSFNIVVSATAPPTVTCFNNTPTLIPQEADTNSANNQDTVQTCTFAPEADLAISKRATNPINGSTVTTAVAGTNLNYVIDVTNNGPSTAQAVTVTDTMPAGIVPQSANGSGWICSIVAQVVTCDRSSATVGAVPSITVQTAVNANISGSFQNTASVASTTPDPDPTNNDTDATVDITQQADLEIVKTHSGTPVAGGTYDYVFNVKNNGPSDTPSFIVSDTLDSNLTFVSAGSSLGCSAVGQVVTCTGGSLALNDSEAFTIIVSVSPSFPGGNINNTATVTPPPTVTDPQPNNNSSNDTTSVDTVADLTIIKSHTTTFVAGEDNQYQLGVTNNGPSDAQNVIITDNLPAGLTFVSGTGTGWTCSNVGSAISCHRASLAAGATAPTLVLTVHLVSSYLGSLDNTAIVSSTTDDSDPTNNSDNDPQTINTEADLAITKVLNSSPMVAGSNETYHLTVTNNGPSDARSLSVTDQLPTGLTYLASGGSGWSCSANITQLVTCTSPYMVTGQTTAVDITVHVAPGLTGSITNDADVTATTPDPNPGNNTDSTTDPLVDEADMAIVKSHPTGTYNPGDTIVFTLNVTNNGPSNAANVTVTDTLPTGMEYVSNDPGTSGFSCGQSGQTITCTRSSFTAGLSTSVTINAHIISSFVGTSLQNLATVTTATTDTVTTNNESRDTVSVNLLNSLGNLANTGASIFSLIAIGVIAISSSLAMLFLRKKILS